MGDFFRDQPRLRLVIGISVFFLVIAAVLCLCYRHWWTQPSMHEQFERVEAGISDEQVRGLLGPPGDHRSDWRPQVSVKAEVWQLKDGKWARQDYRRLDVHTKVGLSGKRWLVWKMDQAVVLVEFDRNDRVCGKIWLTE